METPSSQDVLELPAEYITNSSGLGFDIGGSVAKIVYRSNKEYKQGNPINGQASTGEGKLHLATFARDATDSITKFISENCDLKRDDKGETLIYTTGVGGSQFQTKISEDLKITMKVLDEVDLFTSAFKQLSKVIPKEEFTHTPDPEIQAYAEELDKAMEDYSAKLKEGVSSESADTFIKRYEEQKQKEEQKEEKKEEADNSPFPCIMAMCGSGTGIILIQEDGTSHMVDGLNIGGRFFLGQMNLFTRVKDYSKLLEMATGSDGKSCDVFLSDMKGDTSGTDMYNLGWEDEMIYSFGKGYTSKREDIKDGDISFSLYNCLAKVHAQAAGLNAALYKATKIYYCGNFVNSQFARTLFEKAHLERGLMGSVEHKSDVYFLRHGGMYGALGAYLHVPKPETTTPEETEDTKM